MNVDWNGDENGAPTINPKRPYGNSNVEMDVAEILGFELFEDADGCYHLSADQRRLVEKYHNETKTALQVVLSTGQFKAGVYVAPSYSRDWTLVEDTEHG
jgi:hypothetical protein